MAKKEKITVSGNIARPGQTGMRTIILTQAHRFGLDMATYMSAIQGAENVDYTRRVKLYDLYSEIVMDAHLASVIAKRKSAILFSPIEFQRAGVPDDSMNVHLQSPWFMRFLSDVWDAQAWGFSFFQFYMDKNGWLDYTLIPRKHVDPLNRIITRRQGEIAGESWDRFGDLLFVGRADDLGILAQAAPYVIYKRNTLADWAQFSEIFGMPIRKYIYDANDPEARQKVINDAYNEGGAAVFILPEGTNLELIESGSKSGTADLYEKFAARCNAEISKLFLGNTLTTEASETGTQALGTIQRKGEQLINMSDRKYILNVLNYEMTEIFHSFGINTEGGSFEFVEPDEVEPEAKMRIIQQLYNMGVPIGHDYLYETFGVEKPKDYAGMMKYLNDDLNRMKSNEIELNQKKPKNIWSRFFGQARRDRALEW
jgi:phage gp29-like protein